MIFDKLSEQEKEQIQWYIDNYAIQDKGFECSAASLDKVLSHWDREKEELYHSFGDKFIISKEVVYQESVDGIALKVGEIFNKSICKQFYRDMKTIFNGRSSDIYSPNFEEYRWLIEAVFDTYNLANNSFNYNDDDTNMRFVLPDKTFFKVQNGMKPMKILKKLASAYNVESFEEFRNAHSRCLQTKETKGTLSLSIHPLDYMTMSDNNSNWTSCMNWQDKGCYRLGTVEMMNSPVVIVAYLSTENNMNLGNGTTWNNKKWRCLFIVDKENGFIMSIKQYPYENPVLVKSAATLISETLRWGSIESTVYRYAADETIKIGDREFYITVETGAMYNDCGTCDNYVILNPNNTNNLNFPYYEISGVASCMNCGEYMNWECECDDEQALCHGQLAEYDVSYCDKCDGVIHRGEETYCVEDDIICEDCYNELAYWNQLTGESNYHRDRKLGEVYLSQEKEYLKLPSAQFWIAKYMTIPLDTNPANEYPDCFVDNFTTFRYDEKENKYWVSYNDLFMKGLHAFYLYNEEEFKRYQSIS